MPWEKKWTDYLPFLENIVLIQIQMCYIQIYNWFSEKESSKIEQSY